jgi:hypothetical protein
MHELKKIGKVFTSKFFGIGPSSYKKKKNLTAVSQRLRNTALEYTRLYGRLRITHFTYIEFG